MDASPKTPPRRVLPTLPRRKVLQSRLAEMEGMMEADGQMRLPVLACKPSADAIPLAFGSPM